MQRTPSIEKRSIMNSDINTPFNLDKSYDKTKNNSLAIREAKEEYE